jgi:HrpA-like RNA helicase
LYSDLPPQEQDKAFSDAGKARKIILATNIAETSLTHKDIVYVIDSGLQKLMSYNPRNGLNQLRTVRVSKAAANQRKGRAGRVGKGKYSI